jgi:hypothetical protein
MGSRSNNDLLITTNDTERMRIDSSGNVGIGTTSPASLLHLSSTGPVITLTDTDTGASHQLSGSSGARHFNLKVDTGGSSGSPIFNLSMQDSVKLSVLNDGNVGIGTASPTSALEVTGTILATVGGTGLKSVGANAQVAADASSGYAALIADGAASQSSYIFFQTAGADTGRITADSSGNILFGSGGTTERMRIDSSGNVGIGAASLGSVLQSTYDTGDEHYSIFGRHTGTSGDLRLLRGHFTAAAPDDDSSVFITMGDNAATRFNVTADGDVTNHDNAYGAISDERIKQDIRDSNSQWNDIKAIKVRNYKKKDDVRQYGDDAWEQIGVIAQELEEVSPKLIRHNNPDASDILSNSSFGSLYADGDSIPEGKKIGDVKEVKERVKSVNYSVLYMKAVKALQEAMERIETLEAEVTALKNQP